MHDSQVVEDCEEDCTSGDSADCALVGVMVTTAGPGLLDKGV
jgi:hypothetical protein